MGQDVDHGEEIVEEEAVTATASSEAAADEVALDIDAVEHDVEELVGRLAAAEEKRDEYLNDLQRLAADFDNYRKRVVRDQELASARATAQLVARLLPVLDDLDRALEAAESHEEAKVIEGVRLTRATLWSTLAGEGLVEIETEGPFDPHVHEALMAQPGDGVEPGAVVQVLQKGYRLRETVVRPARVVVSE